MTAVDPAELDGVRAQVRAVSGYEVHFDHFPIHGRCRNCAETD